MNSLSIPVHLSVMTCTAQRQLLLETAENQNFGTESEKNFSVHACCTEVLFSILARF